MASMGRVAVVVLFVCLGVLSFTAEAVRVHENFSARTYYESSENETEAKTTAPQERYPNGYPNPKHFFNETSGKYETPSVQERYPDGYPNPKHVFNKVTGKYETQSNETTTLNPEGRYPHGYHNESWTKYKEGSTEATVKSTGSYYTSVDSNETKTEPVATVYDRYPTGYPKSLQTIPTSVSKPSVLTYDPVQGRYPFGYYPNSAYAGTTPKTTTTGASQSSQYYTAQQTQAVSSEGRYAQGYYPNSQYAGSSTLKATSYAGNFNTLPYPSVGVPFVETGAGCRTAYWAANPSKWPAFFKPTSTMGDAFGSQATEVFGSTTILQALLNYKTDPFSELERTGVTALLNSYNRGAYPLEHMKVIEQFNTALVSKEAATAQALVFETANVESISAGKACV